MYVFDSRKNCDSVCQMLVLMERQVVLEFESGCHIHVAR